MGGARNSGLICQDSSPGRVGSFCCVYGQNMFLLQYLSLFPRLLMYTGKISESQRNLTDCRTGGMDITLNRQASDSGVVTLLVALYHGDWVACIVWATFLDSRLNFLSAISDRIKRAWFALAWNRTSDKWVAREISVIIHDLPTKIICEFLGFLFSYFSDKYVLVSLGARLISCLLSTVGSRGN